MILDGEVLTNPRGVIPYWVPNGKLCQNNGFDEVITGLGTRFVVARVPLSPIKGFKLRPVGLMVNPYNLPPLRCSYILNTNSWASSQCELPAECGEVYTRVISKGWFGNKVQICMGTGTRPNPPRIEYKSVNVVQVWSPVLTVPYNMTPYLMWDGDQYYWIPVDLTAELFVWDSVKGLFVWRTRYVDKFNDEGIVCRYSQESLLTRYRAIPAGSVMNLKIGDQMIWPVLDTIPTAFYLPADVEPLAIHGYIRKFCSGDYCIGDHPHLKTTPYRSGGRLPLECARPEMYYRYNIPLLGSISVLIARCGRMVVDACFEILSDTIQILQILIFNLITMEDLIILGLTYYGTHDLIITIVVLIVLRASSFALHTITHPSLAAEIIFTGDCLSDPAGGIL